VSNFNDLELPLNQTARERYYLTVDKTKPLNFGLSPEFRSSYHCDAHHCSAHSVIADVIVDISVFLCLFVN